MEGRLRSGTSIRIQGPLELDTTTNHGISRILERQMICKSGQLILVGSRNSNLRVSNSLIPKTVRCLMSQEPKMLKDNKSKLMATTVEKTRNGRLFTLTK
jgi:hypothetical protein